MKLSSVFVAVVFSATFVGCSPSGNQQSQENNETEVKQLNADEFERGITDNEAQVLDVRTQTEISQGHVPNAVFMDIMEPGFEEKLETLDKEKPVYVYCRSGGRSSNAAEIMQEMGFTKIYELEGGITNWTDSGKPIEKP